MISSVFVSGRLGAIVAPKIRYVEVDRVIPGESGRFQTDRFLVRTMLSPQGTFMKASEGTYICFKGRLEMDPTHGLLIVDEIDEIFPSLKKQNTEEVKEKTK